MTDLEKLGFIGFFVNMEDDNMRSELLVGMGKEMAALFMSLPDDKKEELKVSCKAGLEKANELLKEVL